MQTDYELKDIRKDIIEASQTVPVVLDFWAEWCGPCKALGPVIEKLASQARGRWKLVKVNVDVPQNQSLAAQFQIQSIPAVKMVYQGRLIAEFSGAQPESAIRKWLDENLPEGTGSDEDDEDELAAVEKALTEGDRSTARRYAESEYNANPDNDEVKCKLAMLLLPADPDTAEKLMKSIKEEGKFEIETEAVATVKRAAGIAAGKIKVTDGNPDAVSLYTEGCKALTNESFDKAADALIASMMKDRSVDEDGARKTCIALFKLLGDKHPVTTNYRRRFSMALY